MIFKTISSKSRVAKLKHLVEGVKGSFVGNC